MIMYMCKNKGGVHFGNKDLSVGWGDINFLYRGYFYGEKIVLTYEFDQKSLTKDVLAGHHLTNWNDDIDSIF
jgi:hypothetical protein